MRSSTSPQMRSGEFRNMSSVWLMTPSVEFSIGTTPKWALPRLHLAEHLVDAASGTVCDRVTEVLERRCLGEGALGAEERDLQRHFQRETGGHDFAEQARHLLC